MAASPVRASVTHKTATAVIHEHLRQLALSFPKVMPSAPKCTTPPNSRCPVSQGVCSLSSRHRRFMPHIPACSHAVSEAALRSAYLCAPPLRSTDLQIHVSQTVSQAASLLTRCVGFKGDNDPVFRCRRWDAFLAIITGQMNEPSRTPPGSDTETMSSSCFQTEAARTPTRYSVKSPFSVAGALESIPLSHL